MKYSGLEFLPLMLFLPVLLYNQQQTIYTRNQGQINSRSIFMSLPNQPGRRVISIANTVFFLSKEML